ncbi:hypothetical protein AB0C34_18840 [Nocardia sp. NPDC049220]|uniref:hypothetical protein n=1 Tax=Nocardia sp. NPDC049220 TaxID=3155273 RepID=UPI0033E40EFA
MRVFPDNNDHNDEDPDERRERGRDPIDPKAIGDILADQFADYLAAAAAAAADNPPHQQPTTETEPPARPTLRLVKNDDTDASSAPWDQPLDPGAVAVAGRTARRRMVRGAAGGSAVVVAATTLATWGQPWLVTGPLAGYGAAWLGYLWWNAALRPSIPDVVATAVNGVGHAIAAIAVAIVTAVRAAMSRIDTVRARHETSRTTPVSPSL